MTQMTQPIDFYFDFSSPYGYFASTRIGLLAAKYGRTVKWHPVLLGAVFKATGGMPLTQAPLKGTYSLHDFGRTARFHDIPYKHPAMFPLPTQLAARAMLWLQQAVGEEKATEFAQAVFHAYFANGVNISEPEQIASIATGLGLDALALLEAANSAPVKERLKQEVDTAMARGVFGSPLIMIDDEPFWGFDRFDQIEATLKNGKI
jgi:2-hydroxychromene-2-carboxylate isomerase